jgi:antitoxin HicB
MGLVARERPAGTTARYRLSLARADEGSEPRWIARVDDLPGCVGEGPTPAAAVAAADAAAGDSAALSHSGRLLLRLPKILHAELAGRADAEQISLNQLLVGTLAEAVSDEGPAALGSPSRDGSRRLRAAVLVVLAADALVVVLAAAAALLILAGVWHPAG